MKFGVIRKNLLAKEIRKKHEKQMYNKCEVERREWKADFSRSPRKFIGIVLLALIRYSQKVINNLMSENLNFAIHK